MQSLCLSRSLFGSIRISLICTALFGGIVLFAVNERAEQTAGSHQASPTPESRGMAQHAGTPTSLDELIQEAEQKNPQIAASFYDWQASRSAPKQASALPETQLSVQQFNEGSPRFFAGCSNSDFAYIGLARRKTFPIQANGS